MNAFRESPIREQFGKPKLGSEEERRKCKDEVFDNGARKPEIKKDRGRPSGNSRDVERKDLPQVRAAMLVEYEYDQSDICEDGKAED